MKKVKQVLFAVFVYPLITGNVIAGRELPDGTVSATAIAVIWLSVVAILIQGQFESEMLMALKSSGITRYVLSFNFLLGLLGCCIIAIFVRTRGLESMVSRRESQDAVKLRLIFLWSFGVGTLISCVGKIWRNVYCIAVSNLESNAIDVKDFRACTVYYFLLILFAVMEIVFLTYFMPYNFKYSTVVHYCMLSIIGANLSFWFDAFLNEEEENQEEIDKRLSTNATYESCFNTTLNYGSAVFDILQKSGPILTSVVLEFALLGVHLVVDIWSPISAWKELHFSSSLGIAKNESTETPPSLKVNSEMNIYTPLLPGKTNNTARPVLFYIVLLVDVVFVATDFIIHVLSVTGTQRDKSFDSIVWSFNFTNTIVTLATIYYGFFCLMKCNMNPQNSTHLVRDCILNITVFFPFQKHILVILAGILSHKTTEWVALMEGCLSMVFEYAQLVFIIQTSKFKPSTNTPPGLQHCILLLTLLAFYLWAINGFVITRYMSVTLGTINDVLGQKAGYIASHIFFPVLVFYRFSVFIAYYALYRNFSKHSNASNVH